MELMVDREQLSGTAIVAIDVELLWPVWMRMSFLANRLFSVWLRMNPVTWCMHLFLHDAGSILVHVRQPLGLLVLTAMKPLCAWSCYFILSRLDLYSLCRSHGNWGPIWNTKRVSHSDSWRLLIFSFSESQNMRHLTQLTSFGLIWHILPITLHTFVIV